MDAAGDAGAKPGNATARAALVRRKSLRVGQHAHAACEVMATSTIENASASRSGRNNRNDTGEDGRRTTEAFL